MLQKQTVTTMATDTITLVLSSTHLINTGAFQNIYTVFGNSLIRGKLEIYSIANKIRFITLICATIYNLERK